jgi:hypothetical protein
LSRFCGDALAGEPVYWITLIKEKGLEDHAGTKEALMGDMLNPSKSQAMAYSQNPKLFAV